MMIKLLPEGVVPNKLETCCFQFSSDRQSDDREVIFAFFSGVKCLLTCSPSEALTKDVFDAFRLAVGDQLAALKYLDCSY